MARTTARTLLRAAGRKRRLGPSRPKPVAWREPVDGRAPRLGPREYIGHDLARSGPWKDRDPLVTPKWWGRWAWLALVGWAGLTAGSGYLSWRRHGGKAALFGDESD